MITTDKEFYSSPYYFFLRDKGKDYSLYFSVESNLTEARKKDEMIKVPKDKVKLVKQYLEKLLKNKYPIISISTKMLTKRKNFLSVR